MRYVCELCDCDFELRHDFIRHVETKKHLDNFNDKQKKLILEIVKYLKTDNVEGQNGLRINSAGGTGKTFCVSSVLKNFKNVIGLGPTNKSVNILKKEGIPAKTFHSFFGWSSDIDENNKEFSVWKIPVIENNTIFVIDEISMMGDDIYSLFKHFIYGKFKYILMGDICQLKPIFDVKNNSEAKIPPKVEFIKNKKDLSLFFQNPNDYTNVELDENMRAQNKELNKIIGNMRLQVLNNKNINLETNFEMNIENFRKYLDTDFIIICWKNDHVNFMNNLLREWLNGGKKEMEQFMKYDKITLNSFYCGIDKETGKKVYLENGYRGTITNVKKIKYKVKKNAGIEEFVDNQEIGFDFFELTLDNENIILTIDKENEYFFNKWYKDLVNKIKKLKQIDKEKDEDFKKRKIDYFRKARSVKNKNCKVSFSFSTTIHKSQGSSYDYVFVFNHFNNYYNQNREKYTACSRSRLELNIFQNFDRETDIRLKEYIKQCELKKNKR